MVLARQIQMRVPAIGPTNGASVERIPTALDSAAYRRTTDAVFHRDNTLPATIWKKSAPHVSRLLAARCPPAVARLVVPVHVDTVDGEVCSVAACTSPIPKAFELSPFRAHGDSAPAVVVPADRVRVRAASLNARPHSKEPGRAFSVNRGLGRSEFLAEAAARGRLPLAQSVASDDASGTTRAEASPSDVRLHRPGAFDNRQSTEHSASHINHGASSHESSLRCNLKGWA